MSKKLLLETLNWLDSLHIAGDSEPAYHQQHPTPIARHHSSRPIYITAQPNEDDDIVIDGREYRRQSKGYAVKKWLRWVQSKHEKRKRYSNTVNGTAIAQKSTFMKETILVNVSINTWNLFYNVMRGLQKWKEFVKQKKHIRINYSLHRALRNSILHVGPKSSKLSRHSTIPNLHWLTKHLRIVLMIKFWILWSKTQLRKKRTLLASWRWRFVRRKVLHNLFCKLEKIQIHVWLVKWKKACKWWSVEVFRRHICLHKAITALKDFVVYRGRLHQMEGITLGLRLFMFNTFTRILCFTTRQKKLKSSAAAADQLYRRMLMQRAWKSMVYNIHQQTTDVNLARKAVDYRKSFMIASSIHNWKRWASCRCVKRRSIHDSNKKLLGEAMLQWFYISCLPPKVKQTMEFTDEKIDPFHQTITAADFLYQTLLNRAVEKYRQWYNKRSMVVKSDTSSSSRQCHYFRKRHYKKSETNDNISTIRSSPYRCYERQAHRFFLRRWFQSFIRRLRLTMLLRNHHYQDRLFMSIIVKKYLIIWKYRVKYTHQPQSSAMLCGSKRGRRNCLGRCITMWRNCVVQKLRQRNAQCRLVRYHQLSYAFQKLWYDRYHIQLKWIQKCVYHSRAKIHYSWTRQQSFFLFWQQWAKDSRKYRICCQAFKKLHPSSSSSKGRQLLRRIFDAWYQQFLPYARALNSIVVEKINHHQQKVLSTSWMAWADLFEQQVVKRVNCCRVVFQWHRYSVIRSNNRKRALLLMSNPSYHFPNLHIKETKMTPFLIFYVRFVYGITALNVALNNTDHDRSIKCSSSLYYQRYRQRFYFMKWSDWKRVRQRDHMKHLQDGLYVISQLKKIQSIEKQLQNTWMKKQLFHAFCAWQQVQAFRTQKVRSILMKSYGQKYFMKWIKQYNRKIVQELLTLPPHRCNNMSTEVCFPSWMKQRIACKKQKKLIGDLQYLDLSQPLNTKPVFSVNREKSLDGATCKNFSNALGNNWLLQYHYFSGDENDLNHDMAVPIDISHEYEKRKQNLQTGKRSQDELQSFFGCQNDEYHDDDCLADGQEFPPPPVPIFAMNNENEPSVFNGDMSEFSHMTDDSLEFRPTLPPSNSMQVPQVGKTASYDITQTSINTFSARVLRPTLASRFKQKFPDVSFKEQEPKINSSKTVCNKLRMDPREVRSKINSYAIKFEDDRAKAKLKQQWSK